MFNNNWNSENIRGKVKSYTFQEYDVIIKNNQIEKGQLLEDCIYKSIFDDKGNNIKLTYYDIEGNILEERLFTYNEKNNIISEINYSNNKINTVEIYEYDSCGNLSKRTYYREYRNPISKYIYEYKNQIVLEHCYLNDKYDYFWFYKYDTKGNQIESKITAEKETILYDNTCVKKGDCFYKRTYKYDDYGNVIEMTDYNTDNSICYQVFCKYNELGDVIKTKTVKNQEEELILFEYEFDSRNNWTKLIAYENNIPITITERTFEYFDED